MIQSRVRKHHKYKYIIMEGAPQKKTIKLIMKKKKIKNIVKKREKVEFFIEFVEAYNHLCILMAPTID